MGADGLLYVADQHNERVQVFRDTREFVTSWPIPPGPNGYAYPIGVCVNDGVVWVSAHQGWHVSRWSTSGQLLGFASSPPFGWQYPAGIAAGNSGDVYLCNSGHNQIVHLDASGAVLGIWYTGQMPFGIAVDAAGSVYVSSYQQCRIYKYDPAGQLLATWGSEGTGPGQFRSPTGLAFDGSGNLWVTDAGNNRLQKFTPAGVVLCELNRFASSDGWLASPHDLAIGLDGDVYVTEYSNNRIQRYTYGIVPTTTSSWGSLKVIYR